MAATIITTVYCSKNGSFYKPNGNGLFERSLKGNWSVCRPYKKGEDLPYWKIRLFDLRGKCIHVHPARFDSYWEAFEYAILRNWEVELDY